MPFVRLSFVFLILCLGQSLQAQPRSGIHGVVTGPSNSEGTPTFVVGATVHLLELDRSVRTNAHGEFLFADVPNGTYHVFVRAMGFASVENTVQVSDSVSETSFDLHVSAIQGEEIIVSTTPYARPVEEQYQSSESKSMLEVHEAPGSTFAEKLSDVPGVGVRWFGSAPARPVLRGLSDNNVLVLENGLRMGDISTYDPAHATPLESETISQVDVVRGPASILYGPSTLNGLVNVLTNTIPAPAGHLFSGTFSTSGNTVNDEYTGYFNGILSEGGHAFSISAGGLHSQDIRIPEGTYTVNQPAPARSYSLTRMPHSFNSSGEAGLGYSYQGNFGTIGIGGKHFQMDYGVPGEPPNTAVGPATSHIGINKNSLELRGLLAMGGAAIKQIRFNANYINFNHFENPSMEDSNGVVTEPQQNHFHNDAINATLQFQHEKVSPFEGTLGVWANNERLTIDGMRPIGPNSNTLDLAGYLFEELRPSDATRFQLGARYDYNHIQTLADTAAAFQNLNASRNSNAFTASLGLVQKISDDISASLSIARSFRAPTVQELFAIGPDNASASYTIGDANLNPETGIGIDGSFRWSYSNWAFLSSSPGGLSESMIELSPYVNFINNFIYGYFSGKTDSASNLPIRRFTETTARLLGFEASASMLLFDNLALKLTADYVHAQDTKNNKPLPFTPPLKGLVRLRYQDQTYYGMLDWRLASSQTRLGDGDMPTAGYGVVNLSAGVRLPQGSVVHNVSLHCDNLLNQVYRDNLSLIKDFLPQPARGFRLVYDLTF